MRGTDHYAEAIGIRLLEAKDGYAKTALTIQKMHTNGLGFTHGGVVFSLADYAFAEACNFGDNVAVALQVSINYLKPSVEGDVLVAEATRVSNGKTTGLYQVTVKTGDKPIALFMGVAYRKQ
jgi:acyl-CoA thioesterase